MQREAQGLNGYHYHGQKYRGQSDRVETEFKENYTDLL